jgi:hypothetical protein
MNILSINALEHVRKFGDFRADEGRLRLVPALDGVIEQLARLLGQAGQHRGQVDDDLPEQIERDGANVL